MDTVETFEGMDLRAAAEYYKYMYENSNASHAETVGSLQSEILRLRSEVEQRTSVIYGEGYTEGMKDGAEGLQTDLAAALARAEKAEGEAATARERGYTDGYAEGTVDGVHDLWNAIVDALNDAGHAGAIKAVHKVLAEYDNLYLK